MLRLRAGLGKLGARWSAFDLGLAAYWVRAHPGEPLQEFLDSSSLLRRTAFTAELGTQVVESVSRVVFGEAGSLAGLANRAALAAYRAIRDKVRAGHLLSDCELFAELIEADADYETLSYFPYLLAWDLEQIAARGPRPEVCVFIDTFEVVAQQEERSAENFLQRCAYLMPNILFVITGRNRIDWGDTTSTGELDFTGADCWPNLHFTNDGEEPRQHLVGYLSESDSDSYLREVLTQDGAPAMAPEIRQRIVSSAEGLPLYLDLSVSHFVALLRNGTEPSPADFGGTFTAVATRSVRDLPKEERNLVRTAALVDRVDADLLRAGQPNLPDGYVGRFLHRPFLSHDDSYMRPYALHSALRAAIREADRHLSDGWSDHDRVDVARRLLRYLGVQADAAESRAACAQALQSGLKLSVDFDIFDSWMVYAARRLTDAGQWMQLPTGSTGSGSDLIGLRLLSAALDGIVLRRTGRAVQAVEMLSEAVTAVASEAGSTGSGTETAMQFAKLHLAHAMRNCGRYADAALYYQELSPGPFSAEAGYWLSDYAFLGGRFPSAMESLRGDTSRDSAFEGERLRLIGHIWRVNARFDEAFASYQAAARLADEQQLAAAEAKALANITQTACWTGASDALATAAAKARELLELVPNPVELVKIRSSEAIAAALSGDVAKARTITLDTRRLADEIGYRGGHNLADVADILADVLSDDRDSARRLLRALSERTAASGGNVYWVPIAAAWISPTHEDMEVEIPAVEWLDAPEATLLRWSDLAGQQP